VHWLNQAYASTCISAQAAIWVARALHLVVARDFFTKSEWLAELGSKPVPAIDSVDFALGPSSALTRGICAGYLGWNSVDTADLLILWMKYGVFQPDMLQHHVMGLLLWGYLVWANRGIYLATIAFITELLVPCGFCLWWYRFSGVSEAALKAIRIIGTGILLGVRLPLWLYMLTSIWFAPGWKWRVGMPALEPVLIGIFIMGAMQLDFGWTKLYLKSLVSKPKAQ